MAGNVLGAECVGSLDYAVSHLPSLRLLAVVGHTGCGAVGAAVDAYLDPTTYLALSANLPLRAIVDAIMPAVRGAARALRLEHSTDVVRRAGYRAALVDTCVVINSAVAADAIHRMFKDSLGRFLGSRAWRLRPGQPAGGPARAGRWRRSLAAGTRAGSPGSSLPRLRQQPGQIAVRAGPARHGALRTRALIDEALTRR